MPGGFTWADAFAGFQAGGQAFIATAGVAVGIAVVVVCLGLLGMALLVKFSREDGGSEMDTVRAEARKRMYQRGAVVDTDNWGQDDIYSEREAG